MTRTVASLNSAVVARFCRMAAQLAGVVLPHPGNDVGFIRGRVSGDPSEVWDEHRIGRGELRRKLARGESRTQCLFWLEHHAQAASYPGIVAKMSDACDTAKRTSPGGNWKPVRERFGPLLRETAAVLESYPPHIDGPVAEARRRLKCLLQWIGLKVPKPIVADISGTFAFPTPVSNWGPPYKVEKFIAGWLGCPGRVASTRNPGKYASLTRGTGDDAGHLIARTFGAPEDERNVSPQNAWQNRNAPKDQVYTQVGKALYRQLEIEWARLLKAGVGIRAQVWTYVTDDDARTVFRDVRWEEYHPDGTVNRVDNYLAVNFRTPQRRMYEWMLLMLQMMNSQR